MHSHTLSKSTDRTDDTKSSNPTYDTDPSSTMDNSPSSFIGKGKSTFNVRTHQRPSPPSKNARGSVTFPAVPNAAEPLYTKTEAIIARTESVLKEAELAVKRADNTALQAQSIVKAGEAILRQAEDTFEQRKARSQPSEKKYEWEVVGRVVPDTDIFCLEPGGEFCYIVVLDNG